MLHLQTFWSEYWLHGKVQQERMVSINFLKLKFWCSSTILVPSVLATHLWQITTCALPFVGNMRREDTATT